MINKFLLLAVMVLSIQSCKGKKKVYVFATTYEMKPFTTSANPIEYGILDSSFSLGEQNHRTQEVYKERDHKINSKDSSYYIVFQDKDISYYFQPVKTKIFLNSNLLQSGDVFSMNDLHNLLSDTTYDFNAINNNYSFYFVIDTINNQYVLDEAIFRIEPPFYE